MIEPNHNLEPPAALNRTYKITIPRSDPRRQTKK